METKYIIIYFLTLLVGLFVASCGIRLNYIENLNTTNETKDLRPVCDVCPSTAINNTQIIEKIVIQEKVCPSCPVCDITAKDQLDLTMPYIRQVKRLDRQLENCLHNNASNYNGTMEYQLEACIRDLNYTKNMFKEWENFVKK